MASKQRNYFIGIVAITVALIFFWSYYPSDVPLHSQVKALSYPMPTRSWNAKNKPASRDKGGKEAHKSFHQEGQGINNTEIGNGEEKIAKEEKDIDRGIKEDDLDREDSKEDLGTGDEEEDLVTDDTEEETERLGESNDEVKVLGVGEESSAMGTGLEKKLSSESMVNKNKQDGRKETNGKRYLIYMCDKRVKCSGFADRQRAIVGVYLMALATNRTFGLIMNVPASIKDFYAPNKVNWDIDPEDLAGKSTIDLDCYSKPSKCNFKDLNAFYPQDVIYLRSKNDFLHILGRLGQYRYNLPDWALGSQIVTFGHVWTTLMKPTELLRGNVNSLLLEVATDMHKDVKIIPKIQKTDSCAHACKEIKKDGNIQSQSIVECFDVLDSLKELDNRDRVIFLRHMCQVETAISPPPLDTIKAAVGYDYVDLGLVCAQVRLGKSSTMRGEPELNKINDTSKIWNTLRPYIKTGHHLFLASDSQEVRDQAKEMFGPRVHVNSDPIVHVNKVRKNENGWQGMKTALMEQLVLTTSCKILVYSFSGFGTKSAMVRHVLTKGNKDFKAYQFYHGRVKYVDFDRKPPKLPKRDD